MNDRKRSWSLSTHILILSQLLCATTYATDYYVSLTGSDSSGDGSQSNPWRTISYAVNTGASPEGGHTIFVEDGLYDGANTITRGFASQTIIKAIHPYQVKLSNLSGGGGPALYVSMEASARLTFDGFEISNIQGGYSCPTTRGPAYLVHFENVSDVTLQNCIIHGNSIPNGCNELVKINRNNDTAYPKNIVIQGNILYDQTNAAGADLLDSVRPGELDIQDNIFVGTSTNRNSQSLMTIKRQAPAVGTPRSPRYNVRRNIFLNWGGKNDQAFIQFGEDGMPEFEITDAQVENNLFLGNSTTEIVAPIQIKGANQILVRANTITGNLHSGAAGFRIGAEGSNPFPSHIQVRNNIFNNPSGAMSSVFINTYTGNPAAPVDVSTYVIDRNLFWNNGSPLPNGGSLPPATSDAHLLSLNPGIEADQSSVVLPHWTTGSDQFPSGKGTIRDEFLRLVESYGSLPAGSGAIDMADAAHMPTDDIRGLSRDSTSDLGAYEFGASTTVPPPQNDSDPGEDTEPDPIVSENENSETKSPSGCQAESVDLSFLLIVLVLALQGWTSRRHRFRSQKLS